MRPWHTLDGCTLGQCLFNNAPLLRDASPLPFARGSQPKLPCSERTSPRTATNEEGTSNAQIAISTTSNRSRSVIRRPVLPVDSDLTTSYGLVRRTCLTGTTPKRKPLIVRRIPGGGHESRSQVQGRKDDGEGGEGSGGSHVDWPDGHLFSLKLPGRRPMSKVGDSQDRSVLPCEASSE
jgi:hypothetical protein